MIEGNLKIDESFEGIHPELIKVKEIRGKVWLTINKGYIPSWLKDVKIFGNFFCAHNNLTSLEGCPKYISGDLYCFKNAKILQLPEYVKVLGRFFNFINDNNPTYKYIEENVLIPRNIEGRKDKLKQDLIKMLSQEVIKGDLDIDESFEGIPLELIKVKEIKGDVLISIYYKEIPIWLKNVKVYGDFSMISCYMLSLKNCPKYIEGDFLCFNNQLTSLKNCPKYIGGDLWCDKGLKLTKDVELKGEFHTI